MPTKTCNKRCSGCALTTGAEANLEPDNYITANLAVMGPFPFYCHALAEPYIVKFYGNGEGAESIHDPLSTVTAKDRFALCIPSIGIALDIRFRMLQPHELAAAMSFKPEYEFTGNREQKVKQIGNAVPLKTAQALCRSLLAK